MAHKRYLGNIHENASLQFKKTHTILIKQSLLSGTQKDLTEKVAFEMSLKER